MCTALTLINKENAHFFGRNMDIECDFNQCILLVPRNFQMTNVISNNTFHNKYAILGMGTLVNNHPLLADAFNEKGLACAGLYYPHYAYYEPSPVPNKTNLGPYDLILWILSNYDNVPDVKLALQEIELVDFPFVPSLPVPTLHWIVYDKNDNCIVIEKTVDKLTIHDNPIGVLTNSPSFDWHLTNLNQYTGLSPHQPAEAIWHKQRLHALGQGLGLMGIPGDSSPASRFVRVAFLKSHATFLESLDTSLAEFFHILNNVAMVGGSVITPSNKPDITLYSSCMDLDAGSYYYNTYYNNQINSIHLYQENLEATEIKQFPYLNTQSICNLNS